MKKKPQDQRDWHERRIEEIRKKHAASPPSKKVTPEPSVKRSTPETPASRKTFPERTKKPPAVGLANEPRPGLGSRANDPDPAAAPNVPPEDAKSSSKPEATKHGYEEPRPEPREQPPDSRAHEEERSTGVSGHTGIT